MVLYVLQNSRNGTVLLTKKLNFCQTWPQNWGKWKTTFLEANMNWLADQSVGTSVKREKKDSTTIVFTNPQFFIISMDRSNVLSTDSLLRLRLTEV